mmetsp:Transcript_113136/g.365500  ORF Transcript_113136/g.365500 Transcript_113136/m.365500 type:complete len:734 (+) Transcript_113136:55-2256(+)
MQPLRAPAPAAGLRLPLLLLALASGPACGGGLLQLRDAASQSPTTRVVDLLKSLSATVEAEGKKELSLYEEFVCWCKSIISTKEASNSAAESRIDALKNYIADVEAGRIEFTPERAGLEKDIAGLSADIEAATEMRNKEESDFLSAKEEMQAGIEAVTSAIEVLEAATKDHKKGVLMAVKGQADSGLGARAAETAALSRAARLGEKVLSKGDAVFLRRVLLGEVPTWDWKKLNRPANFKKGYKARSFKIQDIMMKLLQSLEKDLQEATAKEDKAKAIFTKLMASKEAEKTSAQEALERMAKENAANGQSKAEATNELEKLEKQLADDKKYLGQLETALAEKKQEWQERRTLRASELEALSKAVAILTDYDSRQLFRKSFTSQGYALLQEGVDEASHMRRDSAVAELRRAAAAAHDGRLLALAQRLAAAGHFDEVLSAIDSMLEVLQSEEASDLTKKEDCETERAANARTAAVTSREMDALTDDISRLEDEVARVSAEVAEKQQQVRDLDEELAQATKLRGEEHETYLVAVKEDQDAKGVVLQAKEVIEKFYSENGMTLVQARQVRPKVAAGEAPPPPPSTWSEPYGGKKKDSVGIVAMLGMIVDDIQKDKETADAAENKAEGLYEETKSDIEADIQGINSVIGDLNITKSSKEETVQEKKGDRRMKKGSLSAVMKTIAGEVPGCTFFTVNFPVRKKNRQIEMDSLRNAKAMLKGATFAPPSDALVQQTAKRKA